MVSPFALLQPKRSRRGGAVAGFHPFPASSKLEQPCVFWSGKTLVIAKFRDDICREDDMATAACSLSKKLHKVGRVWASIQLRKNKEGAIA